MNRRKAIGRILLLSGGAAVSYCGFKTYKIYRSPDLEDLNKYQSLVDELAEAIIPATSTPGAREAGVGAYITKMVKEAAGKTTQNQFIDGLDELADYTQRHFEKTFAACTPAEKQATLEHFEEKGRPYKGLLGKAEKKLIGDSFFMTLKKYTIIGYCTSMEGATMGLAYDYIPTTYRAVVPLQPRQRSWATQ